jgi:hypothetical protein
MLMRHLDEEQARWTNHVPGSFENSACNLAPLLKHPGIP